MSDLSETDAESDIGDSFSSTSTGMKVPTDNEGILPFMFEPEYKRDDVELFSSTSTAVASNRPVHRMENTIW